MDGKALAKELEGTKEYFDRSTKCLTEEHAGFQPAAGMLTAAQQVAHVAQTVDWFLEGAFRPEGFDLDFEAHMKAVAAVTSLKAAREWAERAFAAAIDKIGSCTAEELTTPIAPGMVMGGAPRAAIVGGIVDHTAHHRGALTVYSRLQGITPAMPYMDMPES
jgi:uncharacterized damage-inducible protein DinB